VGAFFRHPITAPLVVAFVAYFVAAAVQHQSGFPFGGSPAPKLKITSPAPNDPVNGEPQIRGTVSGLRAGDLVWSYNNPDGTQEAYPDLGPCRVEGSDFACRLTGLGIDKTDAQLGKQRFSLWVVIVTSAQAVNNEEIKAGYHGLKPYVVMTDKGPEHVGNGVDHVTVTCLKALGCPLAAPTTSPSKPPPSNHPPLVKALISSPTPGTYKGPNITVTGTASASAQLWLFDYDYSVYTRDNDPPLNIVRGAWRFIDTELDPGKMQLVLVDASPTCAQQIEAIKPDSSGTVAINILPSACHAAALVSITISK
jgi:hypothetical protein